MLKYGDDSHDLEYRAKIIDGVFGLTRAAFSVKLKENNGITVVKALPLWD